VSIAGIDVPPLAAAGAIPPPGTPLTAFIAALQGKTVDSCGGFAAGQCTALACLWAANLGLKTPCGSCGLPHHCDGGCWQGSGYPGWTWVPNSPSGVPAPGDLVCYRASCDGISADGHVGIFVSGNASSFTGFDQNWAGAFCALHTHDYACVVGWQHPTAAETSSSSGLSCPPGQVLVGSFCYPSTSAYPAGSIPLALALGAIGVGGWVAYQESPRFRAAVQGAERRTGNILRASRR